MHFKGRKCSSGKHSKMCLTGIATGDPFRERLPMFVIEKSQNNAKCFTGVKHLPCQYRSQLKSWISLELFRGLRARPKVWRRKENNCTDH